MLCLSTANGRSALHDVEELENAAHHSDSARYSPRQQAIDMVSPRRRS